MKILRPLLLFTVLLLAVGLACNALTGGGSTPSVSSAGGASC